MAYKSTPPSKETGSSFTFDIVIIGAGSSAAGILHALQRNPRRGDLSIAVIERGQALSSSNNQSLEDSWFSDAFNNPELATGYRSARNVRVGRGLGGGSLINAGLVIPPAAADVANWNFCSKNEFITAMEKVQRCLRPTQAQKSTLSTVRYGREAGNQGLLEYNTVITRVPLAMHPETGHRRSYYQTLVDINDRRMKLFHGWAAEQVYEDSRTVWMRHWDGRSRTLVARHELILCCGSIETPALLHASGFKHTYMVSDHIGVPRVFITWPRLDGGGIRSIGTFRHIVNNHEAVLVQVVVHDSGSPSFCDLAPRMLALVVPAWMHDFVYSLLHLLVHWTPLYWIVRHFVSVVNVFLMNADPVGRVLLEGDSGRSRVQVNVEVNTPSSRDIVNLELAWNVASQQFGIDGIEIFPIFGTKTFCRLFCMSFFHWMGTCKDLVDDQLRLSAHKSIRVCDASVLPRLTSGPPALTCATMGYVLGERMMHDLDLKRRDSCK